MTATRGSCPRSSIVRLDCSLRRNDGHGAGGAREGCWWRPPEAAVEQDRGWGGTWMAGCTWWVVGWADSRPLPSPPPEQAPGERARRRAVVGWEGLPFSPPVAPPPCGGTGATCCAPTASVGTGSDFRWRGNDEAVSRRVCGEVRVLGVAGVRGKRSWRSRCWPAGKVTVAMDAALRRSWPNTPAAMARGRP